MCDNCNHDWEDWVYRMGGIWLQDPHWYKKCKICGKGEECRGKF